MKKYIFLVLIFMMSTFWIDAAGGLLQAEDLPIGREDAGCQAVEWRSSVAAMPLEAAGMPENAFPEGERIKFNAYSAGIKVGSGELFYKGAIDDGAGKMQNVIFKISTFSVNDEDNVFGTLDFSSPVKVERRVRIFGKDEVISEVYSSDHRSVMISKSVDGKEAEIQAIEAPQALNNVLLLLYRLRNDNDLQIGKNYKITLPTQEFELYVIDARKLKTPLGVFKAYYLESKPPKYRIWLSADQDRLPLRIQGLVAGGMLYLLAKEVSHK